MNRTIPAALAVVALLATAHLAEAVGGKPGGATCKVDRSCASDSCVRQSPDDKFGICCTPNTCPGLNAQCGLADNGCGGLLDCGPCDPGSTCVSNQCVLATTTTSTTIFQTTTTSTTTTSTTSTLPVTTTIGPVTTTSVPVTTTSLPCPNGEPTCGFFESCGQEGAECVLFETTGDRCGECAQGDFSCELSTPCTQQSDCGPSEVCVVNSCCGSSGLCAPLCINPN